MHKTGMQVEQWPADRPKPYENNPRRLTDRAIAKVAASIWEFGFQQPIVVDGKGVVIVGHTRLAAAKAMGLETVPVLVADLPAGKAKAYRLADNRTNQEAEWVDDLLRIEFEELAGLDISFDLTGFDSSEIDVILANQAAGLTDPDAIPEPPANPVTRPGDVWKLGPHRLLCGDCTVAADVARVLGAVKPHLMITDPPYGVDYDPSWRVAAGLKQNKERLGKVANDDRADWRAAWALFPGSVAYVWHAGRYASVVQELLSAVGFEVRSQIIWAKDRFALSRGHYHWQHEPCWYAVRQGPAGWTGDRKQSTLWQIPARESHGSEHGTQKPVECMKRPIENNSSPGQALYEPFSGSGTTIIAAEMTGRLVHAIEIDPAYVDVAVKRWQDFTGRKATLDADGRDFDAVAASAVLDGDGRDFASVESSRRPNATAEPSVDARDRTNDPAKRIPSDRP